LNGEYRVSSWHGTANATIRRLDGAVQEVADTPTPTAGPDHSGVAYAPGISYEASLQTILSPHRGDETMQQVTRSLAVLVACAMLALPSVTWAQTATGIPPAIHHAGQG
jgi:hypothetical protein